MSPGICIVFEPVEDTALALRWAASSEVDGDIVKAGEEASA